MPTATRVRKVQSDDGSHEHIEGVCTADGTHYTRGYIASRIDAGEVWFSQGGGQQALIKKITSCPRPACLASPYITTAPDHSTANNLENLPRC
jgi:uncharacterized protein DUF3892